MTRFLRRHLWTLVGTLLGAAAVIALGQVYASFGGT